MGKIGPKFLHLLTVGAEFPLYFLFRWYYLCLDLHSLAETERITWECFSIISSRADASRTTVYIIQKGWKNAYWPILAKNIKRWKRTALKGLTEMSLEEVKGDISTILGSFLSRSFVRHFRVFPSFNVQHSTGWMRVPGALTVNHRLIKHSVGRAPSVPTGSQQTNIITAQRRA